MAVALSNVTELNLNQSEPEIEFQSSCALGEDSNYHQGPAYILSFVLVSVVGVFFNWLVLVGVKGNSRSVHQCNFFSIPLSQKAVRVQSSW